MEANKQEDIKDYAGGWITEREHTNVPSFLRLTYICVALGTVGYVFLYMNGEIDHADRGVLVKQFNAATTGADFLMTAVGIMAAVFFVSMIVFAFKKE